MDYRIIASLYRNPRNKGVTENSYVIERRNLSCGDTVILYAQLNNNVLTKVTHDGKSCMLCTASASIMTDICIGSDLEDILRKLSVLKSILTGKASDSVVDLNVFLNIFNSRRADCVILPWTSIIELVLQYTKHF